jgi:hypothetical protein
MEHAITIGDILFWGGIGLGVFIVGAILLGLLAAIGRGYSM